MIRGLLLWLLLLPSVAAALDLKFGLMYARDPLYNGVYNEDGTNYAYKETPIIGRVELIQRFRIDNDSSFNIFYTRLSQFMLPDPHYGINAVGVELEFNLKLFD